VLSTVVLNWNRAHLLRVTLASYVATVTVPYEVIVVDNASTDDSGDVIDEFCRQSTRHRAVRLKRNLGGPALNSGLRLARGEFLHTSENDIEYRPGWDTELLNKFQVFPELGQLSPFGPQPESTRGEVWDRATSTPATRDGETIFVTETNITTTAIERRQFWDKGFRWGSIPRVDRQRVKLPDDFSASEFVRRDGYWVAWNDRYTVINWGHNLEEWQRNVDYYVNNYNAKTWLGAEGLRQRLRERGYDLTFADGRYAIVKLV
jgi:glycosyltransferase involved in cell wall biosynthesis